MQRIHILIISLMPIIGISQNQLLFIGSETTLTSNSTITLSDTDLNNNGVYNGALKMTSTNNGDTFIFNNNTLNIDILDIEGNNAVNLENGGLNISNAINLNSDTATLLLDSGSNIILTPTAQINNESNIRRIIATDGTFIKITKNHTIGSTERFGNIGVQVDLADADMGNTEIFRRYRNVIIEGHESINRYYEIRPTNNINAEVRFYFTNSDLNGLQQSSLNLYQSIDGVSNWTEFAGTVNDETYPYIKSSGNIDPANFWAIAESGITLSSADIVASNLSLYPNPSSNFVKINHSEPITLEDIVLTDVNGRVIDIKLQDDNRLNLSKLSEGVYFLNVFTHKGNITKKIIIKK